MKARKLKLYILLISFIIGLIPVNVYAEETINTVPVETNSNTNTNTNTYNAIDNTDNSIQDVTDSSSEDLNTIDDTDTLDSEDSTDAEVIDNSSDEEESEDIEDTEEDVKEDVKEDEKKSNNDAKNDTKKESKKESNKEANYTKSELRLLSALIFSEAGNQSYKGKLAVANVVINRTHSKAFSHVDSIKEAIYDKKWAIQFSVIIDGSSGISPLDRALKLYDTRDFSNTAQKNNMNQCIKAAKSALNGTNNIGDYLFFSQYSKSLANTYHDHIVIGGHIFYNIK